jgi:hypothetical protein
MDIFFVRSGFLCFDGSDNEDEEENFDDLLDFDELCILDEN